MNLLDILPEPNSRTFIAGKTNSGKSHLARTLLTELQPEYLVIIDPKGDFNFRSKDAVICESIADINANSMEPLIIFRPGLDEEPEVYDAVLRWIYRRGNTTLYIDELYGMSKNQRTYPHALNMIITRGRTRGITTIMASQRPSSIPLICISESEQVFIFQLKLRNDRKRFAETHGDEFMLMQTGHNFWYYSDFEDADPQTFRLPN